MVADAAFELPVCTCFPGITSQAQHRVYISLLGRCFIERHVPGLLVVLQRFDQLCSPCNQLRVKLSRTINLQDSLNLLFERSDLVRVFRRGVFNDIGQRKLSVGITCCCRQLQKLFGMLQSPKVIKAHAFFMKQGVGGQPFEEPGKFISEYLHTSTF